MDRSNMLKKSVWLFIFFIIYTLLVKNVDLGAIGPEGSVVGFQTINGFFHDLLGFNETWYNITKYLGIVPLAYILFYGINGLLQLIRNKSIKKVDKKLILLAVFYGLVVAFYVLFEKIIINYRPVILEDVLEASYPSSHTLLAVCICFSSLLISKFYIKNQTALKIVNYETIIIMILLVGGRLLSGVHWFTDIVGGVILSLALVCFYSAIALSDD